MAYYDLLCQLETLSEAYWILWEYCSFHLVPLIFEEHQSCHWRQALPKWMEIFIMGHLACNSWTWKYYSQTCCKIENKALVPHATIFGHLGKWIYFCGLKIEVCKSWVFDSYFGWEKNRVSWRCLIDILILLLHAILEGFKSFDIIFFLCGHISSCNIWEIWVMVFSLCVLNNGSTDVDVLEFCFREGNVATMLSDVN